MNVEEERKGGKKKNVKFDITMRVKKITKTIKMLSTAREEDATQEGYDIRKRRSGQQAAVVTRDETVRHA